MRIKRLLTTGAVVGVTALAFAGGCAGQRLAPKLELRAAAQQLADAQQAGFTVTLTGNADDLVAALKLQSSRDGSEDGAMTDDDVTTLHKLFNSSVTIAYDRAGAGAADDRVLAAATIDDVAGTEIRVVDGTVYAKAPVTELAKKLGASTADIRDARKGAVTAVPTLGALFDGKWVAVPAKDATRFSGLASELPVAGTDADKTAAEFKSSASKLFSGADIVRDPADPKHLTVTTSTAKAYAELKRLVTAVGGKDGNDLTGEIGDAPKDRPIVLDLWIDGGKLSAVEINVLQFIDGAAGRVAVRLAVTTGTQITAPPDAVKVDTSTLDNQENLRIGAREQAEMIGSEAQSLAQMNHGDPAAYLRKAVSDLSDPTVTAKVVRRGVVQVTVDGTSACLRMPRSYDADPKVTAGAC